MKGIKFRLIVMNFLQFAVWGAYLTCMGNYLGKIGMGNEISWFYAIQGIVSIFMPTLLGIVGDKWIQPQRLLGYCHLITAAAMITLFFLGSQAASANEFPNKVLYLTIYTIGVAFYMPTLALSNTTAFTILKNNGLNTEKDFPPIRVFGTIGFIASMWFVNCAYLGDGGLGFTFGENPEKFQYNYYQFLVSGILGVLLFLYSFTLPLCKIAPNKSNSFSETLSAFKLFKDKKMATFFIFSMLLGMALQVTNSYATPFLTHFKSDPTLANTFAANNATMLISISQIAEALCILLIPFFLRRFGIKVVMLMAMSAWVLRFGFFGIGVPSMPGVIFFILSCIVYGVAFDFFNVSGAMFVDKECDSSVRSSAQGLFMLMTNGLGGSIGVLAAGKVVDTYCHWENGFLIGDWQKTWFIFAAFSLVVAIAFAILFKYKHNPESK